MIDLDNVRPVLKMLNERMEAAQVALVSAARKSTDPDVVAAVKVMAEIQFLESWLLDETKGPRDEPK